MSEQWKSTPKYWCKHCKDYVRDTKLEKQNHESTPKHQGNIKRFLRDLHRGNEREEREKQKAKDEVARLNGQSPVVSGLGQGPSKRPPVPISAGPSKQQANPEERKRQMVQLAEMGIAIPEDYRREMAMVGGWQTLSERVIYDEVKENEEDSKPNGLNVGVRKRRRGNDEDEEVEERVVRKVWGSAIRAYPGTVEDDDLDTLLRATTTLKHAGKVEELKDKPSGPDLLVATEEKNMVPPIKREESGADLNAVSSIGLEAPVEEENDIAGSAVVFKKRRKPNRSMK